MRSEQWAKILKYEIKKRTFEGKTNPEKNDHALTSEYQPSYKYIAFYTQQELDDNKQLTGEPFDTYYCYRTKQEAIEEMERKSKGYKVW
jgi:hypothetical protein